MQIPFPVDQQQKWAKAYILHDYPSQEECLITLPLTIPYKDAFETVLKANLQKKTLNSEWQWRHFVLTPLRLLYFVDSQALAFKGCFTFSSLAPYSLQMVTTGEEIWLNVDVDGVCVTLLQLQYGSKEECTEWRRQLARCIQLAKQKYDLYSHHSSTSINQCTITKCMQMHQQLSSLNAKGKEYYQHKTQSIDYYYYSPIVHPTEILQTRGMASTNFWNRLTIAEGELQQYARHLDLLLFQSRSRAAALARFVTQSQFDHVALVLRDEREEAFALHATQDSGVCLTPLKELMQQASASYHRVAYRRLIGKHSGVKIEALEQYLNEIIGREYNISLPRLLFGPLFCFGEEEEKKYFCSELVADVYIKFGVLPEGKAAKWWPKDFQQVSKLNKEYSLSTLMDVQLH